jgi:hypothetical protein
MSTLQEIESAVRKLSPAEKQQLLMSVAESLRAEGRSLPEPRRFSASQMQAWLDEDEQDMRELRRGA